MAYTLSAWIEGRASSHFAVKDDADRPCADQVCYISEFHLYNCFKTDVCGSPQVNSLQAGNSLLKQPIRLSPLFYFPLSSGELIPILSSLTNNVPRGTILNALLNSR